MSTAPPVPKAQLVGELEEVLEEELSHGAAKLHINSVVQTMFGAAEVRASMIEEETVVREYSGRPSCVADMKSSLEVLLYDPKVDPRHAKWVIDPQRPMIMLWDQLVGLLLVYTAIVTPYEVAFLEPYVGVLFVLNRFVDLCFLADLVMNFFLAYYDAEKRLWVCSHRLIARRYLTGWFVLDLVSILPFDTVTLVMGSAS